MLSLPSQLRMRRLPVLTFVVRRLTFHLRMLIYGSFRNEVKYIKTINDDFDDPFACAGAFHLVKSAPTSTEVNGQYSRMSIKCNLYLKDENSFKPNLT